MEYLPGGDVMVSSRLSHVLACLACQEVAVCSDAHIIFQLVQPLVDTMLHKQVQKLISSTCYAYVKAVKQATWAGCFCRHS